MINIIIIIIIIIIIVLVVVFAVVVLVVCRLRPAPPRGGGEPVVTFTENQGRTGVHGRRAGRLRAGVVQGSQGGLAIVSAAYVSDVRVKQMTTARSKCTMRLDVYSRFRERLKRRLLK